MKTRFEVQTRVGDGWENTWHEDEKLQFFSSREEAKKELHGFLEDIEASALRGEFDESDYRIKEVAV